MTDDHNISTEHQPKGSAKNLSDTLDRGPGSDSDQPESPNAAGGSGGDPVPSDDDEEVVRER